MLTPAGALEGAPVLHSPSPGEQSLHALAEVRVQRRDFGGRRERKVRFVLPAVPRGADWTRLDTPPPLSPHPPLPHRTAFPCVDRGK